MICYEEPENSPLSHLLNIEHRQTLSSLVNEAILGFDILILEAQGYKSASTLEFYYKNTMAINRLLAEEKPGSFVLADFRNNF